MFSFAMERSANSDNVSSKKNKYWSGEFFSRYLEHQLRFLYSLEFSDSILSYRDKHH